MAIVAGRGAAGDGIGNRRAAPILLARAGTKVIVVDRALALAERTVTDRDQWRTAVAHAADSTSEKQARDASRPVTGSINSCGASGDYGPRSRRRRR